MDIQEYNEKFWKDELTWERGYASIWKGEISDIPKDFNSLSPNLNHNQVLGYFNMVDCDKLSGNKIIRGEYTFYFFKNKYTEKKSEYNKVEQDYYGFTVISDYHGYRTLQLKMEWEQQNPQTGHWDFSGYLEFFDLLPTIKDEELIPIDVQKELYGTLDKRYDWEDNTPHSDSRHGLIARTYPLHLGKVITPLDLDFFILQETKDGLYKPTTVYLNRLFVGYQNSDKVQPTGKKLKDLGIHKVQFRNNTNFNIAIFYDLEGVEVKASKSVLESIPDLRPYSLDENAKKDIKRKEEQAELDRQERIKQDTYTLMQDGKVILKDVRSYDIETYFERKEDKGFTEQAIEAGQKVFNASPDLKKFFFAHYGIYSYTELSGEKFAHCEDLEYVNKLKDIELPKRIKILLDNDALEFPWISTDDKSIEFEKGATFIGVEKNRNGKINIIYEDGEQGI